MSFLTLEQKHQQKILLEDLGDQEQQFLRELKICTDKLNKQDNALADTIKHVINVCQTSINTNKTIDQSINNNILLLFKGYDALLATIKQFLAEQKVKINDKNISIKSLLNDEQNTKYEDTLQKAIKLFKDELNKTTIQINIEGNDIDDISITELNNIHDALSEIDTSNLNLLDDQSKQKISDDDLQKAARKVALLWQSIKNPTKFVSTLIDNGLDVKKLNNINIE